MQKLNLHCTFYVFVLGAGILRYSPFIYTCFPQYGSTFRWPAVNSWHKGQNRKREMRAALQINPNAGSTANQSKLLQMRAAMQINPNDSKCGQHCKSTQMTPNAGSTANQSKWLQMRAALQINPNDFKCGQHCKSIQMTPNARNFIYTENLLQIILVGKWSKQMSNLCTLYRYRSCHTYGRYGTGLEPTNFPKIWVPETRHRGSSMLRTHTRQARWPEFVYPWCLT